MPVMTTTLPLEALRAAFKDRLEENAELARYSSARVGGKADALVVVRSADELAEIVSWLWSQDVPFVVLGGGSNVLVSDAGVRELVLLNRARTVRFGGKPGAVALWAESGANFGAIARQAAQKGYSGLEWAGGIPGTVGGAVFGNAGAHGGDVAGNLMMAEILHRTEGQVIWPKERLEFAYRSSWLKRNPGQAVVLSATLRLEQGDPAEIEAKMDEFVAFRRKTQPPGASMGSMFKNPPGDYAGRLIEAAGLKGTQVGGAQISPLHGNFFVNLGEASATDVYALIQQARETVAREFGVELELEIELLGEW
ncbi:MAG: UDP-N-acetylmuramate dehydrogenase [Anaerolineales bacterium]|nr:UDP-N-acetylmuramate dehydrogenase [Anaerolineales bacterium]